MQCICKKCEKYGFSREMISAGFFLCVCVYWIANSKLRRESFIWWKLWVCMVSIVVGFKGCHGDKRKNIFSKLCPFFFFYFSQAQIQSKNKFLVWFRHGQLHFAKNQNTKLSRIHLILWEWKVRCPVVFIQFLPIFLRLNITSALYQ